MWYNGILFSHKRNEIMLFAAIWMDLETIILSEVRQTPYEISLINGISNMIQMNLSIKQTPDIENNLVVAKEEYRWGKVGFGIWD